jgi:DedD protein
LFRHKLKVSLLVSTWLALGCALSDGNAPKKTAPSGLIATPPSYYSTAKARYLGGKYKENLDRIVERIVRNPKTSTLQFANNISSVGGIGFFTHSAAKTADERYLEVVLATPETFETKGELSEKVQRLFSQYGVELLAIISGDSEIYQDKELTGYGLNLAWRNIVAEPAGNRVTMARAIIYFTKDRVRNFLRQEVGQNDLLGNAVIYSVEEDGPLTLVSYQPREMRQDFRPPIREDDLASEPTVSKVTATQPAPAHGKEPEKKVEPAIEVAKKDSPAANDVSSSMVTKPSLAEVKVESKQSSAAKNDAVAKSKGNVGDGSEKPKPASRDEAEQVAMRKGAKTTEPAAPPNEPKRERSLVPELTLPLAQEVKPPTTEAKPEPQTIIPPVSPKPAPTPMAETKRKKSDEPQEELSVSLTPRVIIEEEKAAVKQMVEEPKAPRAVTAPKSVIEAKRPEMISDNKSGETSGGKSPNEKPLSATQKEEKKSVELPTPVAKLEPLVGPLAPVRENAPSTGNLSDTKAREPVKTEVPAVKSTEGPRPVKTQAAIPASPAAKVEAKSQERKTESAPKMVPNEEKPSLIPQMEKFGPVVAPLAPAREGAPATGKLSETKAREPAKTEAPAMKSTEGPRPVEAQLAIPATPIAKAEVKPQEMKVQTPAPKLVPKEETPNLTPEGRAAAQTANESKTADLKAPEKVAPAASIVTAPIQSSSEKTQAISTTQAAKVETVAPAPRIIENAPAQAKSTQANVSGVVPSPAPSTKSTADSTRPREAPKPDLGAGAMKAPISEAKPLPPVVTVPPREIPAEKPTPEQIALLKKPAEIVPEKPAPRPQPKALEGFIIQLGFNDKEKARRWAEAMERRGYAVSITEAGAEGALRVRLGNFALRDEAERQLRSFKQEGLSGIIINLPQGFRPEARSSIP